MPKPQKEHSFQNHLYGWNGFSCYSLNTRRTFPIALIKTSIMLCYAINWNAIHFVETEIIPNSIERKPLQTNKAQKIFKMI